MTSQTQTPEAQSSALDPVAPSEAAPTKPLDMPDVAQLLGARLKNAREAKGLSIEQVADRLCFTPQRVRNIENSDFSNMPAKAYARGYVQSYAKLLQLDLNEVMLMFDRIVFSESNKRKVQMVIKRERGGPANPLKWFGIGIGGVIIILAGLWWHGLRDHGSVALPKGQVQSEIQLEQTPQNTNPTT